MSTTSDADQIDYRERYAYTLGVQAYVYGFPWVYLPSLRYLWVTQPVNPRMTSYAPVNQFWHGRVLADASWREGGCPNNDTLYSIAWLDVGDEPVILSVPEMDRRPDTRSRVRRRRWPHPLPPGRVAGRRQGTQLAAHRRQRAAHPPQLPAGPIDTRRNLERPRRHPGRLNDTAGT